MTSKEELTILINANLGDKKSKKLLSNQYGVIVSQLFNYLEVLEIIKNKEVVVGLLKGILHSDLQTHTSSYYNSHFVASYRHLTQEEFDLFKEWLSNE